MQNVKTTASRTQQIQDVDFRESARGKIDIQFAKGAAPSRKNRSKRKNNSAL